ncbi:hypothetical protein ACQKL0_09645 [Peribacillus sp. NPDC097264]|uniref:hypothetical protein n=1 Tax=Peribacillus sp. NPDC097264 TaxID=3390616 RepID=UPI003D07F636
MDKVLFWDKAKKEHFVKELTNQMKIKNRLLGLIISNVDKKTSRVESNNKAFKYEQQIIVLQKMADLCRGIRGRHDIKQLNLLIDTYNSLS